MLYRQSGSGLRLPFIYVVWRTITALQQGQIGYLITLQVDFNSKDEMNQKDQKLKMHDKHDR